MFPGSESLLLFRVKILETALFQGFFFVYIIAASFIRIYLDLFDYIVLIRK